MIFLFSPLGLSAGSPFWDSIPRRRERSWNCDSPKRTPEESTSGFRTLIKVANWILKRCPAPHGNGALKLADQRLPILKRVVPIGDRRNSVLQADRQQRSHRCPVETKRHALAHRQCKLDHCLAMRCPPQTGRILLFGQVCTIPGSCCSMETAVFTPSRCARRSPLSRPVSNTA